MIENMKWNIRIWRAKSSARRLRRRVEGASAAWLEAEATWLHNPSDRDAFLEYERQQERLDKLRGENDLAHERLYMTCLAAAEAARGVA